MGKLIYADAITDGQDTFDQKKILFAGGEACYPINEILRGVDSLPAVDAEPVVHGHWEVIQSESCVDGAGRPLHHIICSRCGQYWSMPEQAKTFKRCFACGAIMDGKDSNE